MNDERKGNEELVLAPNEYAYYFDTTKGFVSVAVGPCKPSLSGTDQFVRWDQKHKGFVKTTLKEVKQQSIVIPEGWYCHLKNPAMGENKHPKTGGVSDTANLDQGQKINIPGNSSFALWPGQMVQVIQGHRLRSNQYLVVRIYDVDAFQSAVAEKDLTIYDGLDLGGVESGEGEEKTISKSNLAVGQMFIVKGTKSPFYMPPNGVEVVQMTNTKDGQLDFIQNAVTLEQLYYCILQDEDGNKEFIHGPAVVFPKPTQWFVENKEDKGIAAKKFKAIELNENSGIYVKVIEAYTEGDETHKEGEELFITGRDQKIYYPRKEHALVRYDGEEKTYAVIIPPGQGRYVLDKLCGKGIRIERNPMFLPDPRSEVIIRRILSPREVGLYFPGNGEALKVNASLREMSDSQDTDFISSSVVRNRRMSRRSMASKGLDMAEGQCYPEQTSAMAFAASADYGPSDDFDNVAKNAHLADEIDRVTRYNAPRTLTVDNKYEGAIGIDIWGGYAIMVVDKSGGRKVVQGPTSILLEYDETLEPLALSTGKPKNTDHLLHTAFLRVKNNIVSDVVQVETSDNCVASIKLTYRVNFEGDPKKWFDIENYVKFLSDHCRSRLKNAIHKMGVREFYANASDIVRDIILGAKGEEDRTGLVFEENGMIVSDVEILNVKLVDSNLAAQLDKVALRALSDALELQQATASLEKNTKLVGIASQEATLKHEHGVKLLQLDQSMKDLKLDTELELLVGIAKKEGLKAAHRLEEKKAEKDVVEAELANRELKFSANMDERELEVKQELEQQAAMLKLEIEGLEAKTKHQVAVGKSVDDKLVAALTAIGDNELVTKLTKAIGPLAIFGEASTADLLKEKFGGINPTVDRFINTLAANQDKE